MSQQINLFNPIFLKQKKVFSALNMLEALGLLLGGVLVFYGYASIETRRLTQQAEEMSRQYLQSTQRLAQVSARYTPKKADAALEAEVNNLQAQLNARKAALDNVGIGLQVEGASFAEFLRALARQSVSGLWITGLKLGRGGMEMEIVGRALRPELVPAYIERLNAERALHGRNFDSLSLTQRRAALPVDPSRQGAAPSSYSYTEFRLASAHAVFATEGDAAEAPAPAANAQAGGAATR